MIGIGRKTRLKTRRVSKRKNNKPVDWQPAPDIYKRVKGLIELVKIENVDGSKIRCVRSLNTSTRAYARIWGLNRVWQLALEMEPHYVIEVISEKFDKLDTSDQDKILLHEIAHIPSNFSGALLAHTRGSKGSFYGKLKTMEERYENCRNSR